ncbi:MAG: carboxypeptidase regulatory-like domain-containing protein, partial [Bryobacteraceae bacterium]
AVIPNATVVAKQGETGAVSQTVTSGDGQFTLPFLAPGSYTISIELAGFKRFQRDGLRVSTNERLSLDIQLEVGQTTETVTVTAESPLLVTSTASTGQVINQRQIENMPMNGRTPLILAQLAFGVIPNNDPRFFRPFDDGGPSGFSMGGAPNRQNELLLDGTPDTSVGNGMGFSPPVDAVEEVKVESFQVDAAYGHTGGGTVNMVTKAGTNSFHGTAYNFNQVSALGATLFFTNRAGQRKNVSNYNQWGLTAGGPVVLPKLVDGRNRMFFFFAYEGISQKLPRATSTTVPSAEQRNGDFSSLLALGANYQIYDPLSGAREGSRIRRQPFAGNRIPAARISPVARNILSHYDAPNQASRPDGRDNFYVGAVGEFNTFDGEMGRLDFNLSNRHKLFFSFRHNDRLLNNGTTFSNNATGSFLNQINWGSTVDYVHTLTPTMVLNTRLNWLRNGERRGGFFDGFDITSLGLPASLKAQAARLNFPEINVGGFAGLGSSRGGGVSNPYDNHQLFSSLSKTTGRQSLKFGADLRLLRRSQLNYGQSSGTFTFGNSWTRGPLDNSAAAPIGQELASLLLGLPTDGGWDLNSAESSQNMYVSLFVQDDMRLRPNLTINLG